MNKKHNNIILFLIILVIVMSFLLFKEINSNRFLRSENKILREEQNRLKKDFQSLLEKLSPSESKDNSTKESSSNNKNSSKSSENKLDSSNIAAKEILFFNQNDIKNLTGEEVSFSNVDNIQIKLSQPSTWLQEGFSHYDSQAIANRFSSSSNQARGILKGVAKQNKSLKLILIPINGGLKVNIGSTSPNYK